MKVPGRKYFYKVLHSILQLQTSYPLLTVVSALVLAGMAMFFTVTRLEFRTSQSALISSDNRLMQSLKIADKFSGLDAFVVAVENRNARQSLEFVRALAPRLEADDKHFAQVFSRVNPALFRRWTLLYLSPKELSELHRNLNKHESFIQNLARSPGLVTFFEEINNEMTSRIVGELFTGFLRPSVQERGDEPMDLDFLLRVLREKEASVEGASAYNSPWRSFFSKGGWGELGLICAMGLVVASATTVCLLPALILLFDKPRRHRPLLDEEQEVKPLVRITRQRALILTALTIVATGLSLWGAEKIKFDLHMLHLQSKNAEPVIWETKLIKGSKYPSIYGVLFAHSLPEVKSLMSTHRNNLHGCLT